MTDIAEAPERAKGVPLIAYLLACILAIVAGTITWWATTPSQEQVDLKAALVKLRSASSQGVAMNPFADLVLEARTRLELARPHLRSRQIKDAETAVADWEAVKAIWAQSFRPSAKYCPRLCTEELYGPLNQLGLVKDVKDFDSFANKQENQWGDEAMEGASKRLISLGLTISATATDIATTEL